MAEGHIQVPPDGSGKNAAMREITRTDGKVVEQQKVVLTTGSTTGDEVDIPQVFPGEEILDTLEEIRDHLEILTARAEVDRRFSVDPTHGALRVSVRPPETGVFGSYRAALKSGVIALPLAANAPVFEFRWGVPNAIAIIRKLRIQAVVSTAMAAGTVDSSFSLWMIRNFTAMGLNTGGTAVGFSQFKSQAVSGRMAPSLLTPVTTLAQAAQGNGGLVIAATGALTGASGVTDASPISTVINRIAAGAAVQTIITPEPAPYMIDPAETCGLAPVELWLNEGLYLNCEAMPATGGFRMVVEVAWDEVDPQRYLRYLNSLEYAG